MRNAIAKLVAAFAVVTASAVPAMACSGQAYVSPCSPGFGYDQGYGYAGYERLPDPTPVTRQYYYVNQGPTFSGPGMFAPVPTYQETAIGWRGYPRYDGGPYANPIDHYTYARPGYYAQPGYAAPAIYSYRSRPSYRARMSYRYGYGVRPRANYGNTQRGYAPRNFASRNYGLRSYGQRAYGQRSYVSRTGYHPMRPYTPRVMYAPRPGYPNAHRMH